MGILGSLGFGSSSSSSSPVKISPYSTEQQALLKQLGLALQEGISGPAPSSPDMYVPKTEAEQKYFDWVGSLYNQVGQVPYDIGPEYAEKYFEEGLRPTYELERDKAIDATQGEFAGPGFFGTARAQAISDLYKEYGIKMAEKKNELIYQEELNKRAAIDEYSSRIPQYNEIFASAAEQERSIEQERVLSDVTKFLMGEEVGGSYQMAYNPQVAIALSLLGYPMYEIGTESESSSFEVGLGF